ncbi:MAG: S-layer homology domain-containing protein [Nostoc sp.]|uniref:S-layer homology domain-containing protein n=1 Tax=Nostoc sp. TaxID=1180 RepID=UPI002FFB47C5
MRIWKVAICTSATLVVYQLGHSAYATLSKTATSASINLKPPDKALISQSFAVKASPPPSSPMTETQYLQGTEARQLSDRLTGKLPNNIRTQQQNTSTNERLNLPLNKSLVAQQTKILSDIQGNWAQSFIEPLIVRGIIQGFPDGTFRPDQPVTRAQFATMLQKGFPKPPVRNAVQFVDIPADYWANDAIQAAYKTGFIEGYPNNIFNSDQNIPRVQILVSLVSGLNLSANTTTPTDLNTYFQGASQIPDYARKQVAAAIQNRLIVNHPDVQVLNPNQVATRADVAALIYQALVKDGTLPALTTSETVTQYVVEYKPPQTNTPEIAQIEDLRQRFRVPSISSNKLRLITGLLNVPGSSVSSPTAFGAEFGDVFVGGSYQTRARFTNIDDGGVVLGFGLGEQQTVGLEVAVSSFSTLREGFFKNGGVSFKLHHLFPNNLAIAFGVENAVTFGSPDGGSSVYGVVSKTFQLKNDLTEPFSALTVSLGLGGGRFRSEYDVQKGIDSVNVFGSVALRVAQPISLIADWTGQDLTIGTSIAPFRNIPFVITPAVSDITGNAGDGARFILGFGFGYSF